MGFESLGQFGGDRDGLWWLMCFESTADRRDRSGGDFCISADKPKSISDAFFAQSFDHDFDGYLLFELCRSRKVAVGRDPRPTDRMIRFANHDATAAGSQQCVFCFFHIAKESGEVRNARSIGVAKFHTALNGEGSGHVRGS